jgi:hypothetical protein
VKNGPRLGKSAQDKDQSKRYHYGYRKMEARVGDEKGKAMTVDTTVQVSGIDERAAMPGEMEPVDFSDPDIMRARAAAFALLLQWAKERKEQEDQEQGALAHQSDQQGTVEQACENLECEYTDGNQNPTPADTEVGKR